MPSIRPAENDDYYCTATKLPSEAVYINKFIPHAEKSYAHHMLLYTCSEPGLPEGSWGCGGDMSGKISQAPLCKSQSKIIYAWGMNAPELTLPDDVSFKVGGDTDAKYLVVNVHYKDVSKFQEDDALYDNSGVTVEVSDKKTSNLAGVFLLGSYGSIQPKSSTVFQIACQYQENIVLHPFAFRTHAHSHGTLIRGYRIRDGKWNLIGEKSPQVEQMFYDVENPKDVIIEKNDYLAGECFMKNDEDRVVRTGSTHNDEMCNFYIMYYVEDGKFPEYPQCWSHLDWSTYFNSKDITVPDGVGTVEY